MAFYNAYASGSGAGFYAGDELSRERNRAQLNTSDHFVDMNPDGDNFASGTSASGLVSETLSSFPDELTPQWPASTFVPEEVKMKKERLSVWWCALAVPIVGGVYWLFLR